MKANENTPLKICLLDKLQRHDILESVEKSQKNPEIKYRNKTKKVLKKYHNPLSVYLIACKKTGVSESSLHYFCIALVQKISYSTVLLIKSDIRKATKGNVQITILLQKKTNWHKQIPLFHSFYKEWFTQDNLWFGKHSEINFEELELKPTIQTKIEYWEACSKSLKNMLYLDEISLTSNKKEMHLILYKQFLTQSFLAIIYSELNIIPHILNLKYLWDILEWCYPEIHQKINNNPFLKEILFKEIEILVQYPKPQNYVFNFSEEEMSEVSIFCKEVYHLTEKLYTNPCYENIASSSPAIIPPAFIESENTDQVKPII